MAEGYNEEVKEELRKQTLRRGGTQQAKCATSLCTADTSSSPAQSSFEDWKMQDVNWVVNVLPDMISEMQDDDVDCFSELFHDKQEAREAARLRDEGVLEPSDVEEASQGKRR